MRDCRNAGMPGARHARNFRGGLHRLNLCMPTRRTFLASGAAAAGAGAAAWAGLSNSWAARFLRERMSEDPIYKAVIDLYNKREPTDFVTLSHQEPVPCPP